MANRPAGFVVNRAGPEDAPAITDLWFRHLAETSGGVDPTFTPALTAQKKTARLKRALAASS